MKVDETVPKLMKYKLYILITVNIKYNNTKICSQLRACRWCGQKTEVYMALYILTMYPVTGASGGAILSPWLSIPTQFVNRDPCQSSILCQLHNRMDNSMHSLFEKKRITYLLPRSRNCSASPPRSMAITSLTTILYILCVCA